MARLPTETRRDLLYFSGILSRYIRYIPGNGHLTSSIRTGRPLVGSRLADLTSFCEPKRPKRSDQEETSEIRDRTWSSLLALSLRAGSLKAPDHSTDGHGSPSMVSRVIHTHVQFRAYWPEHVNQSTERGEGAEVDTSEGQRKNLATQENLFLCSNETGCWIAARGSCSPAAGPQRL